MSSQLPRLRGERGDAHADAEPPLSACGTERRVVRHLPLAMAVALEVVRELRESRREVREVHVQAVERYAYDYASALEAAAASGFRRR